MFCVLVVLSEDVVLIDKECKKKMKKIIIFYLFQVVVRWCGVETKMNRSRDTNAEKTN